MRVTLDSENGVIAQYVHDCICNRMETEVLLSYSEFIGGTADAIRFDRDQQILYVFDLKTGDKKTSLSQVILYAALWCLIWHVDPLSIDFDLRIYSNTHSQRLISGEEPDDEEPVSQKVSNAARQITYVQSVADEILAEESANGTV